MDAVPFYYSPVVHGSTPGEILSYPRRVCFDPLPPFYQAVLSAWVAVDGGFYALADTLVVASSTVRTPVSSVSTKSTNSLLLELEALATWSQLFWFGLDLPMIDVSWQIAHGVFRTGHRLV